MAQLLIIPNFRYLVGMHIVHLQYVKNNDEKLILNVLYIDENGKVFG